MHPVTWHPKALETIRDFPDEVKDRMGYLLFRLQKGEQLTEPQVKPMKDVGRGVKEIRVKGVDGVYRSFYIFLDGPEICVFHAFKKKTQKTSKKDISRR